MKKLIVFSGAGMSAESGIATFRDADGLWENHDISEVATPEAFHRNPELVLEFYNQRRRQLLQVNPNEAHYAIAKIKDFDVNVITQNIDDLHERAGSKNVLHLHGELLKVQSSTDPNLVYEWRKDLHIGDCCPKNSQLRPHVVWFGESVPNIIPASEMIKNADILLIIGTSLQVYPAAGLLSYFDSGRPVFYIDPQPNISSELKLNYNVKTIKKTAQEGVKEALDEIRNL